jgi:hypothetical protein
MSLQEQESRCLAGSTQSTFRGALRVLYVCLAVMLLSAEKGVPRKALGPVLVACLVCVSQRRVAAGQRVNSCRRAHRVTSPAGGSLRGRRLCRALHLTVGHADPEIPDAPASGWIIPIPATSGNRESRIRYSDQTGIPDFPNPDADQTGVPHFPDPGIPAKSGFKSRLFFAAARTVIAHWQRQARLVRFLAGVPGWGQRPIVQRLGVGSDCRPQRKRTQPRGDVMGDVLRLVFVLP